MVTDIVGFIFKGGEHPSLANKLMSCISMETFLAMGRSHRFRKLTSNVGSLAYPIEIMYKGGGSSGHKHCIPLEETNVHHTITVEVKVAVW